MRTMVMALVVIALLASPGMAMVKVMVTADGPIVDGKVQLANGATTTIRIWGQGTNAGLFSLAGDIRAVPTTPVLLTSNPPMVFSPDYNPTGLFVPRYGTPGPNGGWTQFGTQQTDWGTPNPNLGKADYIEVCHYTVTAAPTGSGDVTLSFAALTVFGYKPLETDKTAVMGVMTPVTIHVPEPVTLALLALGGLLAARRRS